VLCEAARPVKVEPPYAVPERGSTRQTRSHLAVSSRTSPAEPRPVAPYRAAPCLDQPRPDEPNHAIDHYRPVLKEGKIMNSQQQAAMAAMLDQLNAAGRDWASRNLRAELDEVLDVPGAVDRQLALAQETGRAGMVPVVLPYVVSLAIKAVRQLADDRGEDPYEVLERLLRK
jgi:hypothetical protein